MHNDFMRKFYHFFRLRKIDKSPLLSIIKSNPSEFVRNVFIKRQYTWKDETYNTFIMSVLGMLEPRMELQKSVIQDEATEIGELLFVSKGQIAIGYEVNKEKKYCYARNDQLIIGIIGIIFGQKS